MPPSWAEIWRNRSIEPAGGSVLSQLMAADGFDTGFGTTTEAAWRRYVKATAEALGIGPGSTVFEVGCGAGAYLLPLYEAGVRVAGLDGSSTLVGRAREVMPEGDFTVLDAADLDPSPTWDFVVSSGVFLYFPSLEYASGVLARMVAGARRGVVVLDVPDAARYEDAMKLRRARLGEAEYERRYAGLAHLYFQRSWFDRTLRNLGVQRVRIDDQRLEGYENAAHRFNVFAWTDLRPQTSRQVT